ncbi:hypothetical protein [Thalassotalea eurytherma]|uniref:Uncharacterized protein n=1 Tax=Thalassotalea eurytherma TaxID=1144278 RepID=A0ABQ6H2Y6_9GAMM|nr:hypothetical protein [Thalassotalea eurytherma]GLX81864.1 hypothetical protein theurythT_13160 [Thalassotalea eurytherma]
MEVSGIIREAIIIFVCDLFDEENNGVSFLYGTIQCDNLQRFEQGNWFLSSRIVAQYDDKVLTKDRLYKLADKASHVTLKLDEFRYVQNGHSPEVAIKLAADKSFKTPVEARNYITKQDKQELDEFLSFLKS